MFRVWGLTSVQGSGFGHDSSSPAASFFSGFRRMRGFCHEQVELWPQGTSIGLLPLEALGSEWGATVMGVSGACNKQSENNPSYILSSPDLASMDRLCPMP